MRTKHVLFSLLGVFLFLACEQASVGLEPDTEKGSSVISKSVFSGYVQKGPFINGSSVAILELDESLDQTGKTYYTTIADNSGSFEKKNIELVSKYVLLKADGYYFNEISGKTSIGQITLYALVDVEDVNSANINVLTHLEKPRVEYLVTQGKKSFSEAKKQAQREVLAIFGFEPAENSSETLNLTDNAALLAISCILQSYLSTGDMMELMANISADIKTDGILDDKALGTKLINNACALLLSTVRDNLANKYAELGNNVTIPDFESYIQSFMNSDLYPKTWGITYPEMGKHGQNILADGFVEAKEWKEFNPDGSLSDRDYSLRAEVPMGNSSLKIIIKPKIPFVCVFCGQTFLEEPKINQCPVCKIRGVIESRYWGGYYMNGLENWSNVFNPIYYSSTFTVVESGKPADVTVYLENDCVIEYYENGTTTPTKVKEIKVIK